MNHEHTIYAMPAETSKYAYYDIKLETDMYEYCAKTSDIYWEN